MSTFGLQDLTTRYWLKKAEALSAREQPNVENAVERIEVNAQQLTALHHLTNNNYLAKVTVVSTIFALLLDKYQLRFDPAIGLEQVKVKDAVSAPLLLNIDVCEEKSLADNIRSAKTELEESLKFKDYREAIIRPYLNGARLSDLFQFGLLFGPSLPPLRRCGLFLHISDLHATSFTCSFSYDTNEVDAFVVEHFLENFVAILSDLDSLLDLPVTQISIMNEEDWQQVIARFNNTATDYPDTKTIVDLFEEQVSRSPEQAAIFFQDKVINYNLLNEEANRFRDYLETKYGIGPGDFVSVKLYRNEHLMTVLYGILKSGAAYVPISPDLPEKRISYMEADINSKLTIDDAELGDFLAARDAYRTQNLPTAAQPDGLCYVIYTSGTTGVPKGVMIRHRSLVNRLTWMQKAYPLLPEDVLIQKTTYTFDVSVWELFWWSVYGAKLLIPEPDVEKNPALLIKDIHRYGVTVMHFVPSMLSVFLNFIKKDTTQKAHLTCLKQVFTSGEALKLSQRDSFYEYLPEVALMNLYGPTEATIDVSYYDCSVGSAYGCVPIGKPIDNTQLYILDNERRPVPVGVNGHLYIGGVGVGVGYVNKPELTNERFVNDPFNEGKTLYKSGDLARWLPDGNIEFKGRKDHQVKLRGFRIELEEIEQVLSHLEGVDEAVAAISIFNEEPVLVAYLVGSQPLEDSIIRKALSEQLPDYMIPNFFLELDALPLTANGKLDRKSLPPPAEHYRHRQQYVPPRNETECAVVGIWEDVLGVEGIGVTDNFFELGGHSLLMTEIINRLAQQLHAGVTVKAFMSHPTVETLALALEDSEYREIPRHSDFDELTI